MDVEELPAWIVDKVEDDPDHPGSALITLHLESDPESWMKLRLSKEDAADVEVDMKVRYARISTEAN